MVRLDCRSLLTAQKLTERPSDLSPDARILYSSESIVDVLGYTPDEVVNQSVWDFFPQDEVPYAKQYHKHGIEMDKAAMLAYCRVMDRSGQWVGCECCFTVVYDVMVVCTSIYRSGLSSQSMLAFDPFRNHVLIHPQSAHSRHHSSAACSLHHQEIHATTCCRISLTSSNSLPNHTLTNLALPCSSTASPAH